MVCNFLSMTSVRAPEVDIICVQAIPYVASSFHVGCCFAKSAY